MILTKAGSALVEVLFFFSSNIFLQVKQKTVSSASLKAILKTRHVGTTAERQFSSRKSASESRSLVQVDTDILKGQ